MKLFWSVFLASLLMFVFVPQNSAAQEKKQKAVVKKMVGEDPSQKVAQTPEEIELQMLQNPYFTRELILARVEQSCKRLEKEKLSSSDCFEMSGFFRVCAKQPYIAADTKLDPKYFTAVIGVFDALSKNATDMVNLPKKEKPRLEQQHKELLKQLSNLADHPFDAPLKLVRTQQKQKDERISALKKAIAKQKEEAKRKELSKIK